MPRLEFLLDADMPRAAAEVFRTRNLGVKDVRDLGLGPMKDAEVIAYALEHARIVETRDTDFGEVLRYPKHPGPIILRVPPTTRAAEVCSALAAFLDQAKEEELRGAITIVEPGRVRRRPLQ